MRSEPDVTFVVVFWESDIRQTDSQVTRRAILQSCIEGGTEPKPTAWGMGWMGHVDCESERSAWLSGVSLGGHESRQYGDLCIWGVAYDQVRGCVGEWRIMMPKSVGGPY